MMYRETLKDSAMPVSTEMSLSLEAVIVLCFTVLYIRAQDCLRANSGGGDSLPSFRDPGKNAPRINVNPIQAIITSYQFHCCGIVAGWGAYVEPGGGSHDGHYSVKFQIWRPIAMSTNRYIKVGESTFNSVRLDPESEINETPPADERPHFQPGDVLGYYLITELASRDDGGLQFDIVFGSEEVWYMTGNSDLQNECVLEVGSTGDLSLSTSLGPIISVSVITTENNCPFTFTSTLFCPTPTSTPIASTVSDVPISSSQISFSPIVSSPTTSLSSVTSPTTSIPVPLLQVSLSSVRSSLLVPFPSTASPTTPILTPTSQVTLPAVVPSSFQPTSTQLVTETSTPSYSSDMGTETTFTSTFQFSFIQIHPTPSQVLSVSTTGPPVVESNDNIQLYVGIIIPVLTLVILVVLTTAIILTCVMKKRRVKQSLNVVPYSTVINPQAFQMTAHSNSTADNASVIPTSNNEAYGELEEPPSTHIYDYINDLPNDSSIPVSANGDIPTTTDDDPVYYVNEGLGGSSLAMTMNVGVNQPSSRNEPPIPTTGDETYASVSAETVTEDTYDYIL